MCHDYYTTRLLHQVHDESGTGHAKYPLFQPEDQQMLLLSVYLQAPTLVDMDLTADSRV